MSRGIEQISRATGTRVPVPEVSKSSSGRFGPESEFPRSRRAVPDDSRLAPKARAVEQLSWVNGARFLGPAGLTNTPR